MEHAEIELLLCRQMPHTGHKRLPERPIIRPFGKDFVDRRVMNRWFPIGVLRHGQALPLHPRVEDPQDEIKGNRSPYENRNHAAACDGISQAGRRDGAASPCRAASWAAVRSSSTLRFWCFNVATTVIIL